MDIVCFNEFSHKCAACKSDIVNIVPFLKLISVIAENSAHQKDWVAEVKTFPQDLPLLQKKHLSMLNGDVLDLGGGISSGATYEIFRLVSLGPANSLSHRSLARLSILV